jgi:hypothetical protein
MEPRPAAAWHPEGPASVLRQGWPIRICAGCGNGFNLRSVRIAKPLLLVTTPLGMAGGLFEAYRLAGGLVLLMAAMMGVIGVGCATLVATVRQEKAAERARLAGSGPAPDVRS